ncbi:tRNA (adenosine(37)-N6)-threonylcarbamoyltransferase complex dimerization subunit type 1 TsaB [Pseudonocardia benzenivorans]|uniref:Universal protein YeaZ n=2 Tax=Pseudonocardia TaxID=1847 RepID=F4CW81_PSEUX|nr:tRNA (adenosine(37)-N6)-threonylcarbamoyltransferase complex dimerization subunit type 1 TsaB [Pseudonocardia dioxanivorans]AEA27499.1 universal protein YeaZ [Pseudonocardia dioxanivorans CB1190]GJF06888.1 tRNA (adenosine(37)-N6)-threonylcarbamoyltransferase complex dimerization subunit type 1 TsaB [Pseudonocardia sp. D17]
MLVLALDTSTSTVTAGVVDLPESGAPVVRAQRVSAGARKHGELLMPHVLEACAEAGVALRDVDAIVTGTGPGPFTGLRVGMVTAAALGDALGTPVHGVCSHDAIAREACATRLSGNMVVVTDARRREVYWAGYDAEGYRITGPHVEAPAVLVERLAGFPSVAAAGEQAAVTGLPVIGPATPGPAGLVAVAADVLRAGTDPGPLRPLYLRRPDAVEPGARKRVSA